MKDKFKRLSLLVSNPTTDDRIRKDFIKRQSDRDKIYKKRSKSITPDNTWYERHYD